MIFQEIRISFVCLVTENLHCPAKTVCDAEAASEQVIFYVDLVSAYVDSKVVCVDLEYVFED